MHARNKLVSFIGLGSDSVYELLYEYVRLHPEICTPEEEINFFNDAKAYAKGIDWYESRFENYELGTKCGELSTGYLKSAQSASLIARAYPDARLFAIIENPLMAVRIAYVEAIRTKKISSKTLLSDYVKQNPELLSQMMYGKQLVRYFSFYSQNDFLVLIAEDVRNNLLANLSKVFSLIEVDDTFVPTELKHLVLNGEDDTKKAGILKRSYKFIYKCIAKPYNYLYRLIKPPTVPVETTIAIAEKIRLSPELETYLKSYFKKDVEQLSSLLHRDMNEEWRVL